MRTKKINFVSPNDEFKPKTTYIILLNVENGLSWEFTTSVSTHDVETILQELGLDLYISTFRENHIDMDTLMLLEDHHFTEMGIPLGPRLKIRAKIQSLKMAFLMESDT